MALSDANGFDSPATGSAERLRIRVFVQNEAGRNVKNYHDEKTLKFRHSKTVSHAYPYPYGFIIGTDGHDGCNVDCFILTDRHLATGTIVECEAIGLMEQYEDGVEDYNVLARLPGETAEVTAEVMTALRGHIEAVFRHIEGKRMDSGEFSGPDAAIAYIEAHREMS